MAVESTKIIDGLAFEVHARQFKLVTDVTTDLGGLDRGPDPHDYLQVALAACTAITIQMYAKRKSIPLDYADVKIKITSEGPTGNMIVREITLVGQLSNEQKSALLAIAEKCPIHRFLTAGAKIETHLALGEPS